MAITGGCLCRAVRYEIDAAPIAARFCWCRVCQYFAAGNATVNAAFPKSALKIAGEMSDYESVADSGSLMHRRFCPVCGTQISSEAESRPHLVFIRVGTFDNAELIRPAATIWAASAPSWACIEESIPRHEGQPPPVA